MREPAFTETLQIGIVVRDLEATMRRYVVDYGIGPWDRYEFNPENAPDLHEHGQPAQRSWRLAVAMVGHVQWELIEPLDDESVYARFLAEKGEGVHHIAVAARNYDELVASQAESGKNLVLSGTFSGVEVAYLDTETSGCLSRSSAARPGTRESIDAFTRTTAKGLEDVEGVRILGGAKETMGIEAGEGSTFAHFLTPWGMMLEFVSFPNGRKYMENRDQLLWSPVNPAA